jgi:hypothetical protein
MATSTAHSAERRTNFYDRSPIYFALALLAVVVGFFPSYFGRLGQTDALHHLHGITATIWMVMLVGQSWLARVRKISLHRLVGKISLVIAPLFVVSGLLMVRAMLMSESGFNRAFGVRLAFVDILTVVGFGAAYALAIYHRREIALHARYMAVTAVLALPPALARALGHWGPGINSFEAAFHGGYLLTELIVVALLVHDYRAGKIRPPYLLLGAVLGLEQVGFVLIPHLQR